MKILALIIEVFAGLEGAFRTDPRSSDEIQADMRAARQFRESEELRLRSIVENAESEWQSRRGSLGDSRQSRV